MAPHAPTLLRLPALRLATATSAAALVVAAAVAGVVVLTVRGQAVEAAQTAGVAGLAAAVATLLAISPIFLPGGRPAFTWALLIVALSLVRCLLIIVAAAIVQFTVQPYAPALWFALCAGAVAASGAELSVLIPMLKSAPSSVAAMPRSPQR